MPITSNTFVRATALLLLAGLVALLAIVGTTIWLVERSQEHFDEVVAAREARSATADLRAALQDAETGQRGYLLTREEPYLEPYTDARGRVGPSLDRLDALLARNPEAGETRERLRSGIAQKLQELDSTVALARQGRAEEALEVVRTDQGKAAMDEVRNIFNGIVEIADSRINASVDSQRASADMLRWVAILGAGVIIAVVGGSAWTVMVYTRELAHARQQLETTNIRLEERVAERTSDLARANEEVQRFAYIVTHDLRAPLVNIMGFTSELETCIAPIQQFMERSEPGDDPVEQEARLAANEDLPEAIDFIRSSTRKMDGLINAILKISRDGRRAAKPEEIDLGEMLEMAASAIHHQVSERGGEVVVEPGLPKIVSDRMSLEQIFGNLLDNAVKYSDPARPLRVRISGGRAPRNAFFIDVEDNGRGIASQDNERVFELFRRSGEQSAPGEGIGLAHVRTLVRNLGGDITLSSELGKGSTFRVSLARDIRAFVGSSAA